MRYIGTFFWSVVLISMVNYVVSAVQDVPFNFMTGVIISLVVSLLIFVITSLIPDKMAPHQDHH